MLVFISINKLEKKHVQLQTKEPKLILVGRIRSLVTIPIMQRWIHYDCMLSEQLWSYMSKLELTSRQHFPRCMLDNLYIQQVGKYSFFNMAFSKSENAAFSSKCIQLFTV